MSTQSFSASPLAVVASAAAWKGRRRSSSRFAPKRLFGDVDLAFGSCSLKAPPSHWNKTRHLHLPPCSISRMLSLTRSASINAARSLAPSSSSSLARGFATSTIQNKDVKNVTVWVDKVQAETSKEWVGILIIQSIVWVVRCTHQRGKVGGAERSTRDEIQGWNREDRGEEMQVDRHSSPSSTPSFHWSRCFYIYSDVYSCREQASEEHRMSTNSLIVRGRISSW